MNSIELHTAEEIRTGIRVFFTITDDKGFADVKMVIPAESLENYIVSEGLNIETFTNWKHVSLECDGMDEREVAPDQYLTENLNDVVTAYLEANLERDAA